MGGSVNNARRFAAMSITGGASDRFRFKIAEAPAPARAYVPLYRAPQICPGCGGEHWFVSRLSAECAFCTYAMPIAPVPLSLAPTISTEGETSCRENVWDRLEALFKGYDRA